jgi:DNA-binding transcriptional regulator YhcF (GntR family)
MNNNSFTFSINHESDIIKYQQLINSINNAIAENLLEKGDLLPSVNNICKDFGFEYKVITNPKEFDIEKNKAYIGVSDRMSLELMWVSCLTTKRQ